MYTCGLTVYARGHIGNFRTFVCVDVLRRTLRHLLGYDVRQVMNFTDVDDRTIAGAQNAGMDLRPYTDQFIAMFREDARALGLEPVEEMPRATDPENIKAMADLVARARSQRGHTYRSDGSVYFKISTLPDYGKLARLDHDGMQDGARVDADNYDKEDARDFVLWKATKPGEPHLGCRRSAGPARLASRVLGDGAAPARRAADRHPRGRHRPRSFRTTRTRSRRAKGRPGKPFSRFWVHVEYLLVDDQKMSKSLGNTYTMPDVVGEGLPAVGGALPAAVGALSQAAELHLGEPDAGGGVAPPASRFPGARRDGVRRRHARSRWRRGSRRRGRRSPTRCRATSTPPGRSARSSSWSDRSTRPSTPASSDAAICRRFATRSTLFDAVLGILSLRRAEDEQPPVPIDEIEQLIEERNAARRRRDFATADRIRDELAARGVLLEDSPAGTRWKRK